MHPWSTWDDHRVTVRLSRPGAEVKEDRTDDWPWGAGTWEKFEGWMEGVADWASGEHFWEIAPSLAGDESVRRWWGKMETNAMMQGAAVEFMRMVTRSMFDTSCLPSGF